MASTEKKNFTFGLLGCNELGCSNVDSAKADSKNPKDAEVSSRVSKAPRRGAGENTSIYG